MPEFDTIDRFPHTLRISNVQIQIQIHIHTHTLINTRIAFEKRSRMLTPSFHYLSLSSIIRVCTRFLNTFPLYLTGEPLWPKFERSVEYIVTRFDHIWLITWTAHPSSHLYSMLVSRKSKHQALSFVGLFHEHMYMHVLHVDKDEYPFFSLYHSTREWQSPSCATYRDLHNNKDSSCIHRCNYTSLRKHIQALPPP